MSVNTEKEYLKSISTYDTELEHEDGCGLCFHKKCMSEAAKEILNSGDNFSLMQRWVDATKKLWEEGKYYKLWQEEKEAGRDPHEAFTERGWET